MMLFVPFTGFLLSSLGAPTLLITVLGNVTRHLIVESIGISRRLLLSF